MKNKITAMSLFGYRAASISTCIYFSYLIINFTVIFSCQFLEIGTLVDTACRETGFATGLTENIPVIDRAVSFLLENDQLERAELVSSFYSFSWITSLLAFFLFSIILFGRLILLTPDERREIGILHFAATKTQNSNIEKLDGSKRFVTRRWFWIILFLIFFSFYMAFFSDYDFDNFSILDNRVYERDIDLFRVPLFLFFAWYLLSILMILFALRYCMWAAGLRLDDPESRAPSQDSQIDDDGKNTQSRAEERPREGPWWPD